MARPDSGPIVALATPGGPARRAVLRISGPGVIDAAAAWFPPGFPLPSRERAVLEGDWEWAGGACVEARVLVFPGPDSATGEDVLEIHLPGSPPVVESVLAGFHAEGVQPAAPGEFTRRAFLNGKLDLTQAEAVADLVEAETAEEAKEAARILCGDLAVQVQAARGALASALVEIEAGLDFEEGDSQDLEPGEIETHLARARAALEEGLRLEDNRRIEEGGRRVGLLGAPNAGKSSLFSSLTGAGVLISPRKGTTRDRLEGNWDLGEEGKDGVVLGDGPGLGGDSVDARDEAARIRSNDDRWDLLWLVVDGSDSKARLPRPPGGLPALVVFTKADIPCALPASVLREAEEFGGGIWTSAQGMEGRRELASRTAALLQGSEQGRRRRMEVIRRHQAALSQALEALAKAEEKARSRGEGDLLAEDLRQAGRALGVLVGELAPEELLDLVFSRFCIGK